MGKWICNNCETINDDKYSICEVCEAHAPFVTDFSCDCTDLSKPLLCQWEIKDVNQQWIQIDDGEKKEIAENFYYVPIKKSCMVHIIGNNDIATRSYSFPIIINKPTIKIFDKEEKNIYEDQLVTLNWEIQSAEECFINDTKVQVKGLEPFPMQKKYVLTAKNSEGVVTKTIHINPYNVPEISFTTTKRKIKDNDISGTTIKWNITNAKKVKLFCSSEEKEIKATGQLNLCPKKNETYNLEVIGLDGKRKFTKSLTINVFPEATFTFESDKEYVFPTIPFTLTWETKNAKKVELNGKPVSESGSETFINGIEKDAIYTLSVTDEFETRTKTIIIKQLPIPRIESINVPLPNLEQTINFSVDLRIPDFKINVAELELSKIELNDSHLKDVDLEKIDSSQIIECIYKVRKQSLWKKIKNMISRIVSRNGK